MTIREDMIQRIKEYRSERTVTGRALAILVEQAMAKMTEETLNREYPNDE